jgi:aryl-alcohol dehydrogenase-like predicted oxidoreductase
VIGYGGWEAGGGYYGDNPPDEQMIAAMRAGFDAGINWVDTAEAYGAGRSEELVAKAIEDYGDVFVATKVVMKPFGSGIDAAGIRTGADQSRRRLRRDVLDLYQLHLPDASVPIEESLEAMARLVDDGAVGHIGVSNFPLELVQRCERLRHVDTVQLHFSLLYRDDYRELQPFCEENDIAILAYGPLGFGVLTGTMTADTRFPDNDWRSGGVPVPVPLHEQIFAPKGLRAAPGCGGRASSRRRAQRPDPCSVGARLDRRATRGDGSHRRLTFRGPDARRRRSGRD